MNSDKVLVTEFDLRRLKSLLDKIPVSSLEDKKYIDDLRAELERACVVPSSAVPPNVITMNSRVLLRDLKTGEEAVYTLVFPGAAGSGEGQISILAPVGTALIGYRVGDVVECDVPAGRARLKVKEILYQPEAAGNFHE